MSYEETATFTRPEEVSKDPQNADILFPNFKLGDSAPIALASDIFQKNNFLILDDVEDSFVILGKNVIESIRGSSPESEEVQQSEFNDHQSVFSSVSQSTNVEHKLHETMEENTKLKEIIEKNESVMEQQFKKMLTWQKEVISVCNDNKHRYLETRDFISRLKAENDLLRINIQSQNLSQSTKTHLLSATIPQLDDMGKELNEREVTARMNVLPLKIKNMQTAEIQDSSLESNMTLISLNTVKTQTPSKSTQSVSTETESVHTKVVVTKQSEILQDRSVETQTPAKMTQCVSTETESAHTQVVVAKQSEILENRSVETQTPAIMTQCVSTEIELEPMKQAGKSLEIITDRSLKTQTPAKSEPVKQVEKLLQFINDRTDKTSAKVTPHISNETESYSENLTEDPPESLADLSRRVSELQAYLKKTNSEIDQSAYSKVPLKSTTDSESSKIDKRDIEIMYLLEINNSLKQQIEKLQTNSLPAIDLQMDKSITACPDSVTLKENVDAYNQILRELTGCFASTFSRYIQGQNILKECTNIIEVIETAEHTGRSTLTKDNLKIYKNKLCDYRKKLMDEQVQIIDDKQTIIKAQKQFQKILSDCNVLISELALLRQENLKITTNAIRVEEENQKKYAEIGKKFDEREKKLNVEQAFLIQQQQSLSEKKDLVHVKLEEVIMQAQALSEEKEKLVNERKSLNGLKVLFDRHKQLHEVEKSILEREISLLRENSNELTKKLEDIKAESEDVCTEKESLLQERTNLKELRTLLDDEIKSNQVLQESLVRENKMLKNKCDIIQSDLDNFNLELDAAHKIITELKKKNVDLRNAVDTVDAYKIQSEEHKKDMIDMEKNYLNQIQKLIDENRQLREEYDGFRNANIMNQ